MLVAQLCARVPGGTARYTRDLVEALAATSRADQRLLAAAPARCAAASGLPVPVEHLPLPVLALSRLWEYGLPPRLSGQVVHAPTLLVPPRRRDQRLVVTIHDTVPWTHPETLTKRGVAFHQRMARRAADQADLLVTPTEAVAEDVRRTLRPHCPVEAVPPGTPHLVVPADEGRRRREIGLDRRYVLFVGTAEPRKGLDVLIAAMADPRLDDLDLVVVGPPGWGSVQVDDLAQEAGVSDRVRLLGWVDEATLAAVYAGAAAVAMPSRAEGFGLPVVEAMSCGTPVVISTDPALMEVSGGAAYVSTVGDRTSLATAIAAAVTPGAERDRRVAAGRVRSDGYAWEPSARILWERYATLAGAR